MTRNKIPLFFWIFLTAFAMVATFFFSSQNAALSSSSSLRVLSFLLRRFPFLSALGGVERLHIIVRKLAHFTLYFTLGCGLRGLYDYQRRVPAAPAAVLTAALYAASDEFHQRFSSGRGPSLRDVALDACGAAAGCALISLLFFLTRPKNADNP